MKEPLISINVTPNFDNRKFLTSSPCSIAGIQVNAGSFPANMFACLAMMPILVVTKAVATVGRGGWGVFGHGGIYCRLIVLTCRQIHRRHLLKQDILRRSR